MNNLQKLDQPEILNVLFYPRKVVKSSPPANATNIDITVAEDTIIGSRLFTSDKTAPTLIFFHGNGEIVPDYDDIGPIYMQLGMNFIVADYRGYGWSDGSPSASALISDGRVIFEHMIQWLSDNEYSGHIFVMGRSMGSAPAIDLASHFGEKINGLIIDSGFAETVPLAQTLGINLKVFGITEYQCFNNLEKIRAVTIPTFLLHGQRDSLIPLWHAEKLHATCGAKSKELQIIPGADHNTLIAVAGILYFQAIKGYVDKITGKSDWRSKRRKFKDPN